MSNTPELLDKASLNPSEPYARERQTFPALDEALIERIKPFGMVEDLPQGTCLFERGDCTVDFFVVLKGIVIPIYN